MLKLNLGCGPHVMQGWENLDLYEHPGVKKCDLSRRLPYEDKSVSHIFSEHFIEHLTKLQAEILLKECYRLLIPRGVVRISTPDLGFLIYNYDECNITAYGDGWKPKSPCDMVNEGMRLWGHQYLWDRAELLQAFIKAGFREDSVQLCHHKMSDHEEFRNKEVRPFYSDIIMEATK